ncbi:hypothetical protein AB1282_24410 [Gottfriedia sp. S16(2024)]|uniref:hypothetical protein n=1 Tax=Bacillaceae TaxID=186817 RepID=UPI0006F8AD73|nr:hypothetical protein [Bacillus sp. FJAT-25509]
MKGIQFLGLWFFLFDLLPEESIWLKVFIITDYLTQMVVLIIDNLELMFNLHSDYIIVRVIFFTFSLKK